MGEITPIPGTDAAFQLDMQQRITIMEENLYEVRADLDFIKEHIVKATTTIDKVSEEVMPTINALMESPLVKMLGMKKGK